MMDKEKFKKSLYISLIIFLGLALAITYFFLLYSNASVSSAIGEITVILRPFIVGAVLAYIMKSTCNAYERLLLKGLSKRKKSNPKKDTNTANVIAVILTYITWAALLAALLVIAVPQIVESVSSFVRDISQNMDMYISTVQSWIEDFKVKYPLVAPYIDTNEIINYIKNWITAQLDSRLPEIVENVFKSAVDIVNVIKDIAIGLVVSVLFLAGRKTFAKKSKLIVNAFFKESHAKAIISEARYADRMFGGFLEGKIIDSTIIGFIYFIALILMDIRYAALLALICGITNIIPFFGPFIGAVPSGLIILMSNENPFPKLLYFIIFVCVIQFIDGNIIDPHIVGGNIKISPFCVIFAVLLFGGLWGFWGLLIGVPTFAVIYDIIKKFVYYKLRKSGKNQILRAHIEEFEITKRNDKPQNKTLIKTKRRSKKKSKNGDLGSDDGLQSQNDSIQTTDADVGDTKCTVDSDTSKDQ